MRSLLFALTAVILCAAPAAAQRVQWERRDPAPGEQPYFDTVHDDSFAYSAYQELTGRGLPTGSTRGDFAEAVLAELDKLPAYGQKSTANLKPAIPDWLLDGYRNLQPTSVARSRYLDGVIQGRLPADADSGALYAFWSAYDAEWFSLSRHAVFKAWLSAVLLTYPPRWMMLKAEGELGLHERLVAPIQTKDEPFREIDNWINNFTKFSDAFSKPKVRDALVKELLAEGGLEADRRFYDDPAYSGATPKTLGLSDRQFYLLAALTLEYFQELYEQEPATQQPLHFRDFFIQTMYEHMRGQASG